MKKPSAKAMARERAETPAMEKAESPATERAEQRAGLDVAMSAMADRMHPVRKKK